MKSLAYQEVSEYLIDLVLIKRETMLVTVAIQCFEMFLNQEVKVLEAVEDHCLMVVYLKGIRGVTMLDLID